MYVCMCVLCVFVKTEKGKEIGRKKVWELGAITFVSVIMQVANQVPVQA